MGSVVTVEEVNAALEAAASGHMSRVLAYDPEAKVSVDFNHTEHSSIVAPEQTLPTGSSVLGGGQYEVQLTLAGAPARCVIDDNAEISTLALVG